MRVHRCCEHVAPAAERCKALPGSSRQSSTIAVLASVVLAIVIAVLRAHVQPAAGAEAED